MSNTIKILALILTLAGFAAGQTVAEKKAVDDKESFEKEAVAFLRETLSDVNGMRSLENRISFTAELAGLMWFRDEREARAMYAGVIADFKDLLTRYDAQMNALGVTAEDGDGRLGPMSFMVEPTDKARVLRRFATAMGVRQQIAMSIAEHDAELAYSFYNDSLLAISNPEFRKQGEGRDSYFESQLIAQIAETNPGKAAQYGGRSLGKGVEFQHIELLKKIYAKDAEKGAEFAASLLGRLKTQKINDSSEFYLISSLMEFGGQTLDASRKPGGKKPAYSQADLRELAELLAQAILNRNDGDSTIGVGYVELIQKYAPGRAAQIRTKFRRVAVTSNNNAAVNSMYTAASNGNSSGYGTGSSNSRSNTGRYEREMREREEREKVEQKLFEDVQSLGTKQLPKEEREKIIAQARKIITQTPGRDKKIMALSFLASQVAKLGDKELAVEIMRDAEALIDPSPKNYQDFLLTWMLASVTRTPIRTKHFLCSKKPSAGRTTRSRHLLRLLTRGLSHTVQPRLVPRSQ